MAGIKTSLTHPPRIAEVIPVTGRGRIGITFCPGKKGESLYGGYWDRDLGADLRAIRDWGAAALVSLIETHEMELLQVPHLGERAKALGLNWYHLPIVDVSVPGDQFEEDWEMAGAELRKTL